MKMTSVVSRERETTTEEREIAVGPLVQGGAAVPGIELWQQVSRPWGRLELVELAPGAELPLHGGENYAFCQVVAGRGKLGLPDGGAVDFAAPHLFVFEPETQHSWFGIEEHTVMAIFVAGAEE